LEFIVPKLVLAVDGDFFGLRCLNDNDTLGVTNFTYSAPYTINQFDYIDEFFTAPDGVTYARVLFINNLEAPRELSSQRHYYKLAEVIQYPVIPGLVVTPVHENVTFNPWILQNWIIAHEEMRLNVEQWHFIQFFMEQQFRTEQTAILAYNTAMESAHNKRQLQSVTYERNKLIAENRAIKDQLKLSEQIKMPPAKPIKLVQDHVEPKLSKTQKQQIRRADISLKTPKISALATMASLTFSQILSQLQNLNLNDQDRVFFTQNLDISITACGYLLSKLHRRTDINIETKRAFLYKLNSYTADELIEYAKNNPTQNFITMAFELSKDQDLHKSIQSWAGIYLVKLNKSRMLANLDKHFKSKQPDPQLLLEQAILNLNSTDYIEVIRSYPELDKTRTSILKSSLLALNTADPTQLKQFLQEIKLTKDIWRDIYTDPKTAGTVKIVAQQWAEAEAQELFESVNRKTKPVKIPWQLLALLKDKTNSENQTILMLAFAKAYPDDQLEKIFERVATNILTIDYDDRTILHYIATYYKGSNYELIRRIRDTFISAIKDAKQHFSELIRMQSDRDGGSFLHCLLRGENEDHACNMIRLFLNDPALPPALQNLFRATILDKNANGDTVASLLDFKATEWEATRQLLYGFIPDIIADYKFAYNYGSFFDSKNSAIILIELVLKDPSRFLDVLDSHSNLQLAGVRKMESILKKQPADLIKAETCRLNTAIKHFEFDVHEKTLIPGTMMNIHRAIVQVICTAHDENLTTKYLSSKFYTAYEGISMRDTLLWNKFTHAFKVCVDSAAEVTSPQGKNLSIATLDLVRHLTINYDKIYDAIACFFDLDESQTLFLFFIDCITRDNKMATLVYNEFFKFKEHRKFSRTIKYLAYNFSAPGINSFAKHLIAFALQEPVQLGLLLQLLTYNRSSEVTTELMKQVGKTSDDYDAFIATAFDLDSTLLICNLLCDRDEVTARNTMQSICRFAAARNDFAPALKILDSIKNTDFLQYLLKTAIQINNVEVVETLKERQQSIAGAQKTTLKVEEVQPNKILQRPKIMG